MSSVEPWQLPDYDASEMEQPDDEVMVGLLAAVLRLSVDTLGLARTANTVSEWLSAEADTANVKPNDGHDPIL